MTDREIRSDEAAVVQKQAEEALQESEERYRSIFNAGPDDITNTGNGEPGKGGTVRDRGVDRSVADEL